MSEHTGLIRGSASRRQQTLRFTRIGIRIHKIQEWHQISSIFSGVERSRPFLEVLNKKRSYSLKGEKGGEES